MKRYLPCLLLVAICAISCSRIVPTDLRCQGMSDPACIEDNSPVLSWTDVPADESVSGQSRSAYRIVVSSSLKAIKCGRYDIWDSGRIISETDCRIPYGGPALSDASECWWKVAIWDKDGRRSRWSKPSRWVMGIRSDWGAEWIAAPWDHGAAPLFSGKLELDREPESARLFVSARGWYEVSINGSKVGHDFFSPAFTNADHRPGLSSGYISIENKFSAYRQLYLSYDVRSLLHKGTNAVDALVGEGYYNSICPHRADFCIPFGRNAFICRLDMRFRDGSTKTFVSDGNWTVQPSAIVSNGLFTGESYDASWKSEANPRKAEVLSPLPGSMTAQECPADRIVERIRPLSSSVLEDGSLELDFGREITGWIRMDNICGAKGDTISIRFISESPSGTENYYPDGQGPASYAPRFTWFVFRKAVVSASDKSILPQISYTAEFVRSDIEQTSVFEASDTLLERIQDAWILTQSDNMHCGIASDCPHRERIAYNGDGQVVCNTVLHNFDAAAFYRKWLRDMRDSQHPLSGYVPNSSPWQPAAGGGVPWGASINIIPWECYVELGDIRFLEENYEAMVSHLRWMTQWITERGTMLCQAKTLQNPEADIWLNLGEWAPSSGLPKAEMVHSFYLWRCATYTAKASRVLGRTRDCEEFSSLAESVRNAVNRHLYDEQKRSYGDFGSNVFALVMGVPSERYDDVAASLYDEIAVRNSGHLNTGIFGTRFLFETLCDIGFPNLAYKAFTQKDCPSYGYWLGQGSTTTWELWKDQAGHSHNHPMFGGGIVWMYTRLAGIRADENEPGYRHFYVDPVYVDGLGRIYYSNDTPRGRIACEVIREHSRVTLNVTVPPGCRASVRKPGTGEYVICTQGHHSIKGMLQ